ncbi:MAG: S4 domain-containing protein YaaA [Ureaplasma sp.]|nr:S4 domain-containing protein YaaA [Ureaplasma sp.]
MTNEIKEIQINTEYIELGKFLKWSGIVSMGSEVKEFLLNNKILVNDEFENRRGRKIYKGMIIKVNNDFFKII